MKQQLQLQQQRLVVRPGRHALFYTLVAVCALLLATQLWWTTFSSSFASRSIHISQDELADGIDKCQHITSAKTSPAPYSNTRDINPHYDGVRGAVVIIRNATLWDPEDGIHDKGTLVVVDGVIRQVIHNEKDTGTAINLIKSKHRNVQIVDAAGRFVTPGIVDMHSHAGSESLPHLRASRDNNEGTNPTFPALRIMDSIKPDDPALTLILSGGVTTSLILPGSANIIGGEGAVIKMRQVKEHQVDQMLIGYGVDEQLEPVWRYMKMACGENPKRRYGDKGVTPSTRMGSAFLLRKQFKKATALKRKQDNWCAMAAHEQNALSGPFPEDIELESMVALLRGQVKLNVHCYTVDDIGTLLRVAREFNATVSALHHGLEAYRMPETLKQPPYAADNNSSTITVATFADHWGYKQEAYLSSVYAPAILAEHNIPVAIKSDHPVTNAQYLIHDAGRAHHYGLDANLALASVTSVPAKSLGLGHRLGRLLPGMDADIVIWDSNPLTVGARPAQVFVDGISQFDEIKATKDVASSSKPQSIKSMTKKTKKPQKPKELECLAPSSSRALNKQSYIVRNIGRLIAGPDQDFSASSGEELVVAVSSGRVACVGSSTSSACHDAIDKLGSDTQQFDLNGGWLIPGLISHGNTLGLNEITQDAGTADGSIAGNTSAALEDPAKAADGLMLANSRKVEQARLAGVTNAITAPISSGFVSGISTAFSTATDVKLAADGIHRSRVALHVSLKLSARGGSFPAVSTMIGTLRARLTSAVKNANSTLSEVAHGKLPLVVEVDNQDTILTLIRLKADIEHLNGGTPLQVIIQSGAESWLVADRIAEAGIAVALTSVDCTPKTWDAVRCPAGPPLTPNTNIGALLAAGVKTIVGVDDSSQLRALTWEAGRALRNAERAGVDVTETDAIGWITWGIADAFGLGDSDIGRIAVGAPATFVAYTDSPLEFGSDVQLVADGSGRMPICKPQFFIAN